MTDLTANSGQDRMLLAIAMVVYARGNEDLQTSLPVRLEDAGLSYKEIGLILGKNTDAVRMGIARSRKKA